MVYKLKKNIDNPSFIEKMWIDSPSSVREFEIGNSFHLAGWLLSKRPSISLYIKHSNGFIDLIKIDQPRPDVLKKIKGYTENEIDSCNSSVGFSKNFIFSGSFSLFIKSADESFEWLTVEELPDDYSEKFWKKLYSGYHDIELKKKVLNNVSTHMGFNNEFAKLAFGEEFIDECKAFEEKFYTLSSFMGLIRDLDNGIFPFIISSKEGKVVWSSVIGSINFIYIKNAGTEYYYIQHISSIDAVYFPKTNDLVLIGGHAIIDFINEIIDALKKINIISNDIDHHLKLEGYLVGYHRPYHILYDTFPIFNYLLEKGFLSKNSRIYFHKNFNFISYDLFKEKIIPKEYSSHTKFNDFLAENKSYIFKIGFSFQRFTMNMEKSLLIDYTDKILVEKSTNLYKQSNYSKILDNSDFVLWVGITGQKRLWLEQVDGIKLIVNYIREKYQNPCVVIDGWTSVLEKTENDKTEIENDMKIFNSIFDSTNQINYINLIGATLLEKIYVASKIDFFVTNALTGSINVARICRKPGIAHHSRATLSIVKKHNLHPKTYLPKLENIQDIEDKNQKVDFFSYSINIEYILEFFKESLASALKNDFSNALSYKDIFD